MSVHIYIAGKISGEDMATVHAKFGHAADILREHGYEVLNPVEMFPERDDWQWHNYMLACLEVIWTQADAMLMLPCWQASKGARHEHFTAQEHGLKIYYGMDEI